MLCPFSYFLRRSAASLSRAAPVIRAPFLIADDFSFFAAVLVSVATAPPLRSDASSYWWCVRTRSMIEQNRPVRHRWHPAPTGCTPMGVTPNCLCQLHQIEVVGGPVVL